MSDTMSASGGSDADLDGSGRSTTTDDSVGHVFDQTNGVADGLEGDSDGTAGSDTESAEDRLDDGGRMIDDAAVEGDVGGAADRTDPNP